MGNIITKEVARVVANWWADKVCHPMFDNGDESHTGAMAMMMAMLCSTRVTEEQCEKFINALIERIEGKDDLFLDVDYHPSTILREAAEVAGIGDTNFPWKTWVRMDKTYGKEGFKIIARYGYRGEIETLYEEGENNEDTY